VRLLLDEAFRHAKAIGGWGDAERALAAAGCDPAAAGIVLGDDPQEVCSAIAKLLAAHRVWDRFPVAPTVAGAGDLTGADLRRPRRSRTGHRGS
jgi:catalase